jgi:hypothetical protein
MKRALDMLRRLWGFKQAPAAGQAAAIAAARAEAAAEAVKADRERWRTIMALEEAQGREGLADHLYATTDMPPELVRQALAVSPRAAAPRWVH